MLRNPATQEWHGPTMEDEARYDQEGGDPCGVCGTAIPVAYLTDEDSGVEGYYCGRCLKIVGAALNMLGHEPEVELLWGELS